MLKWDEFWDAIGTAAVVVFKSFTYGLACLFISRPASRLGRLVRGGSIAGPITFVATTLLAARFLTFPFDTIGRVASLLPKSVPAESFVRGFIDSADDAVLLSWILLFIVVALHVQIARLVGTARRATERSAWLGYYLAYLVVLFTSVWLSGYFEKTAQVDDDTAPVNSQYPLIVAVLFPVFSAGFWWVWELKLRTKSYVYLGGLGTVAGAIACILTLAYTLVAFQFGMGLDHVLWLKKDAFERAQRIAQIAPASVSCELMDLAGGRMMNCRAVAVNISGAPVLIGGPLTGSLVAQTSRASSTFADSSKPLEFFKVKKLDLDQSMKLPSQVKANEVFAIPIPSFDPEWLCRRMREDGTLRLESIKFTLAGSIGSQPAHARDHPIYINSNIATWNLAHDISNQILDTCGLLPDRKP